MFTWICQKCGSEVPPSENDCPNCRARGATAADPAAPVSAAPGTEPVTAPPIPSAPSTPAPRAVRTSAVSPAVVAIGSAAGILALLAILYLYVLPGASSTPVGTVIEEQGAAGPATPAHPLAKYIEISGVRIIEDRRGQAKIAYLIVNHSPADLPELQAQITLNAAGKDMFTFPATIPSIGPYESKDLTTTVKTQLKPYELPDWQMLKPAVRISSER